MFFFNAIKTSIYKKFKGYPRSLLVFLQLQLFITLVSWPILLSWGLPISVASFLGNFIFSPFLILFLFLSSLIFFSELFGFPNSFFIVLLEYLTTLWLKLIMLSSRSWLLVFTKPPIAVCLLLVVTTCMILGHKKLKKTSISILALTTCLCIWLCYFYSKVPNASYSKPIVCYGKELFFIRSADQTVLIDPGILGRKASAVSWVSYTLVPELIKTEGLAHIDHVILLKASATTFNAIACLCQKISVGHVYIVEWTGTLSNSGWAAWEKLLGVLKKYKTPLIRINAPIPISLDTGDMLTLAPSQVRVKKNKLSYPRVCITGSINNSPVSIHPY